MRVLSLMCGPQTPLWLSSRIFFPILRVTPKEEVMVSLLLEESSVGYALIDFLLDALIFLLILGSSSLDKVLNEHICQSTTPIKLHALGRINTYFLKNFSLDLLRFAIL